MRTRELTQVDVMKRAIEVAERLKDEWTGHDLIRLYGIPRGGVPAALAVRAALGDSVSSAIVARPELATHFIDDIVDSGATINRYLKAYPGREFYPLYRAGEEDAWLVFPWEGDAEHSADDIPRRLLQYIGEDPQREGLRETPARFLKAWSEYTSGYSVSPVALLKSFEDGAERVDEMVLVRDIPVYSHCEHHLAPFFGVAHIAYIPSGRVLGLSKFARLVDVFAKRLQVQERMTQQIAYALQEALQPRGVGVVLECRHMCMEARGVRARGASTTTSCLLGALKEDAAARAEFMRLVR